MSGRVERVQALARQVLSEEIFELKDPRVGLTTVTAVRISPDLQHARVYVSVLGAEEVRAETMQALVHATPYLRSELGKRIRMKYTPELVFQLDTGAEEAERLESLLKGLHESEEE